MTLSTLANHAANTYELLHRIGPSNRRSRGIRVASRAGWIGVGIAMGSGVALLLTPRSGPEMRQHLGARAKRVRDYLVTNGVESADTAPPAQIL